VVVAFVDAEAEAPAGAGGDTAVGRAPAEDPQPAQAIAAATAEQLSSARADGDRGCGKPSIVFQYGCVGRRERRSSA
jgi:hypothetical protein